MEVAHSIWHECQSLLSQGGPVLWIILIIAVVLYTTLVATWRVLRPLRREIQRGVGEVTNTEKRQVVRDYAIFELDSLAWVDRRMPVIGVMVGICTLAGLLGTVSGMLTTFSGLASQVAIDPIEKIAHGISEAMITTQAGLLVAIPAALFYALLQSQVKAVHGALQERLHGDLSELMMRGYNEEV